jgi:hypothetical protein
LCAERRNYDGEASDQPDRNSFTSCGYGSRTSALEATRRRNYDLREDRREQDRDRAAQGQGRSRRRGDLTGAKADAWKKIDALATELKLAEDKIGDTVVERVKKAGTLEGEKSKAELSTKRKDVAKTAGVNGDVLDPLLDQFGLEVRTTDMQVQGADGKTTMKQVAEVRKAGDANASWERLTDFVAKDGSPLKPFAAALNTKASGQAGTPSTAGTSGATGIVFPDQQGGSGGAGGTSMVDDFLKKDRERANRSNPLRQPTQTQTTKGDGAAA